MAEDQDLWDLLEDDRPANPSRRLKRGVPERRAPLSVVRSSRSSAAPPPPPSAPPPPSSVPLSRVPLPPPGAPLPPPGAPLPPPEAPRPPLEAPRPPLEAPLPPLSSLPPPPSDMVAVGCESCGTELERPIPKSRYCPRCRFACGNPYRPGTVLGIGHAPANSQSVTIQADLNPVLDGMPFDVELRCLMDIADWKHDLKHAWPDSGVSLFLQEGYKETRLLKVDPVHGDEKRADEDDVPYTLTRYCMRMPSESHIPLVVKAKFNFKKGDPGYYLAVVSVQDKRPEEIVADVKARQKSVDERYATDLRRVNAWVNAHRRDRTSNEISCLEPPIWCVQCPVSMMRIEVAARGEDCEHLQPFDLDSFIHTMRYTPAKSAWLCPICSRVCLPHKIVLDAYGQQVINETQEEALEVLVAKDGRYEVSKFIESESETSDAEAGIMHKKKRRKTQRENKKATRERERLRAAWAKLQEGERQYGFMMDGQTCSRCNKTVADQGGLMCGRPSNEDDADDVRGCGLRYCWKCMNQARDALGTIRTTKAEFLTLENPWWMHDTCMNKQDERAYFGEDEEEAEKPKGSLLEEEDDGPDTFAWE